MIEYDAFIPLGRRLLVKPDPLKDTYGTIKRPEIVYERAHSGTIVAISADWPLAERRGLELGQHIGWGPHGGVEVRVQGETYYLLDDEEPWGIVAPATTPTPEVSDGVSG